MIEPPPVTWVDVDLDPGAARDAAEACDALADEVEECLEWSRGHVRGPLSTWRGAARQRFVREEATLRTGLADRAEELRAAATALRDAAGAAESEQHRRESERETWFDWDRHRRGAAAS